MKNKPTENQSSDNGQLKEDNAMNYKEELFRSEIRYRGLFDNLSSGVAIFEAVDNGDDFVFVDYNRAAQKMDQVKKEDVLGKRVTEVFPGVKVCGFLDVFTRVWRTGKSETHPLVLYKDDALDVWRKGYVYKLPTGEIVSIYSDETKQKKTEAYLKLSRIVFENSQEAILITDLKGNILDVNPAFTKITGYSKEDVLYRNASLMKAGNNRSDLFRRFWKELQETGHWQGEIWDRKKNGEIFPKWLSVSTVFDDDGKPLNYIGIFNDLSIIKKAEEDINRLNNYDILTKLPNRSLFYDRLKQSIEKSSLDGKKIAVILLDIDKTARINESYGISFVDELLVKVAERLKENLLNAESLSRLVSDRFIFYISRLETYDPIAATIQKIKDLLAGDFKIDESQIYISASIGVTIFPNDASTPNELIKNAEIALNHAKMAGAGNFQFFSGDMTTRAFERMKLEMAVRMALDKNELHLYYQPKVDLSDDRVVGMEALIRWIHPEMGIIPPFKFIPIAETSDVILAIGEWVLRQACITGKKILDMGYADFGVGVNLSAKQLKQENFVEIVRTILNETGLPPRCLDLELTESMLFDNIDRNIKFMHDLKKLGITLSIDDFGTGYSSLSYLKSFPVNTLKIDRSFVMDIPDDRDDMAITATIISMAHSLGLNVVAEGVETRIQAHFLKNKGCLCVQGYLFSPPVPEEKFMTLLGRH
ncbi:Diguanylate cyclase/phosphodiesterase with PAS/PAC sensor(S) (fragment) [Desulfamplus magnetovallimortis]|uniref:Diguanylate cyclase/phosphodiesterase with PAS/PAC sensor(S) n=1 Tax=Desulfamplus magnetovallimortis TaxID=1246637 RepID=A0A1W1HIL5_9BACT